MKKALHGSSAGSDPESGLTPKFYQASSTEMFGKVQEIPQRETAPFYPRRSYEEEAKRQNNVEATE